MEVKRHPNRVFSLQERAELHSAGAITIHRSPFHELQSHTNTEPISAAFTNQWAVPFYMEIARGGNWDWVDKVREVKPEVTRQVCLTLLGEFNWRTRLVGAYFAAVKDFSDQTDIIGVHLLKSEVCCVGHLYALVLAYFKTEKSINYLHRYLDYYLTKPALEFDQAKVLEALLYLDASHGTNHQQQHHSQWRTFCEQKVVRDNCMRAEMINELQQNGQSTLAEQLAAAGSVHESAASPELTFEYFKQQMPVLQSLTQ